MQKPRFTTAQHLALARRVVAIKKELLDMQAGDVARAYPKADLTRLFNASKHFNNWASLMENRLLEENPGMSTEDRQKFYFAKD